MFQTVKSTARGCIRSMAFALVALSASTPLYLVVAAAPDAPQESSPLHEKTIIALREYRIAVYRAYRLDRSEFDRRRQAANDAVAAWRTAGGNGDDLDELHRWLSAATVAARRGHSAVAPPIFGEEHSADRSASPPDAAPIAPAEVANSPVSPPEFAQQTPSTNTDPSPSTPSAPASLPRADAPLERTGGENPLVDDPAREPTKEHSMEESHTSKAPSNDGSNMRPASVNLDELAARIRGWNLALTAMEDRIAANRNPSIADLSVCANQLEELLERRAAIKLYLSVLSPSQREQLGQLQSAKITLQKTLAQIESVRLRTERSRGRSAGGAKQLRKLEQLRSRIETSVRKAR